MAKPPEPNTELVPAAHDAPELARPWVAPRADHHPVAVYLAELAPGSRDSVMSALRTAIAVLSPGMTVEAFPWPALRFQHVTRVRSALAERGLAPATINRVRVALRGVLRAAWNLGLLASDDHARIIGVKAARGVRLPAGRALDVGELAQLFAACADGTTRGARDTALLALLFGCGLRRAEAVGADLSRLNLPRSELRVIGKRNKERAAHLSPTGAAAVAQWLVVRKRDPGALLLPVDRRDRVRHVTNYHGEHPSRLTGQAVAKILNARRTLAGLEPVHAHDLRRTFITLLLDQGVDIARVQRLAGHDDVSTTTLYDRRDERGDHEAADSLFVPAVIWIKGTP